MYDVCGYIMEAIDILMTSSSFPFLSIYINHFKNWLELGWSQWQPDGKEKTSAHLHLRGMSAEPLRIYGCFKKNGGIPKWLVKNVKSHKNG